jgi:predicted nuclease with TOPRIM domain
MNIATIATAFAIAAGVLALGAAVVIGLRGKALQADLDQVRKANGDLRDSNADLRTELDDKERRLHDLEVDNAALKADSARKDAALARIGEQAASGAELQQVANALREASGLARDHDREAAGRHAATIRTLREVVVAQQEVRDAITSREETG